MRCQPPGDAPPGVLEGIKRFAQVAGRPLTDADLVPQRLVRPATFEHTSEMHGSLRPSPQTPHALPEFVLRRVPVRRQCRSAFQTGNGCSIAFETEPDKTHDVVRRRPGRINQYSPLEAGRCPSGFAVLEVRASQVVLHMRVVGIELDRALVPRNCGCHTVTPRQGESQHVTGCGPRWLELNHPLQMLRRSGIVALVVLEDAEFVHGSRPCRVQSHRIDELATRLIDAVESLQYTAKVVSGTVPLRRKRTHGLQVTLRLGPSLTFHVMRGDLEQHVAIVSPFRGGQRDLLLRQVGLVFHLVCMGHPQSAHAPAS